MLEDIDIIVVIVHGLIYVLRSTFLEYAPSGVVLEGLHVFERVHAGNVLDAGEVGQRRQGAVLDSSG